MFVVITHHQGGLAEARTVNVGSPVRESDRIYYVEMHDFRFGYCRICCDYLMGMWVKLWVSPRLKHEGLFKLSAKYRYKLERSRERYMRRPDRVIESTTLFTGQIGSYQGFRFS